MSTRWILTVQNSEDAYHVYVHDDGAPEHACEDIIVALERAWPLPRFEPDEFAAAFVATRKTRPGGVRLLAAHPKIKPDTLSDRYGCDYRYVIEPGNGGQLLVSAYEGCKKGKRLFTTGLRGGESLRKAVAKYNSSLAA